MNLEQARDCVEKTFRHKFDEDRFLFFTRNLVNHLDETKRAQFSGNYIKRAFAEQVGHYLRLGTYSDPRGELVDVLVIHLRKETTLARGRVTLRNFVADYLASGHGKNKDAVIAAFVSPVDDDWRFSFVKLDFTFEKTELGLVTERRLLTPARRSSYLVGENENCHTAQKQFIELLTTDIADPTVAALEAAFGVEKVTKEFYDHYRILFEKTRDALKKYLANDPRIENHFAERGIEPDDFSKKLLGQIVFLYFLQKKGWFGVERGQPWGSGNKGFIRHLFTDRAHFAHLVARKSKRDSNFFNDILEPLFYDALARPRLEDDHYYPSFDCRIPFLNGGLFEPLYGYKWDDTEILLSDTLFSNDEESNEGDKGTGILDVFDRYNFTVNEAEPLEKEVAVDPEMLGKVFENLLPENIRHSSGTYYTPRVIVHYMCQQALLHYLTVRAPEVPQDELARFFHLAERFADFEATDTKAHADKRLPPSVATNAQILDKLLNDVTVCDPAIGSGAFPVGMMHEIVRARLALTASLEKRGQAKTLGDGMPRTAYGLKRHAIHHSLYGVDIDPGAVEIAKLRLWLSMVVDEDDIRDIQPLPNLDYKIMQGNSLLDEFEGIRLFDEKVLKQPDENRDQDIADLKERIRILSSKAIRAHADGKPGAVVKLSAERDIARLKKALGRILHNETHEELELNSQDSWRRLARLQSLHSDFFRESNRNKKDEMRAELEKLEWDFMRATLREQGREQALAELERASAKHRKPFFLWWLHFSEIKQKSGGFDIVVGNPPYVRIQEIKRFDPDMPTVLKSLFKSAAKGNYDLYVVFTEKALRIIASNGIVAFIQPHKFINAEYGAPLREFLSSGKHVEHIVHFGDFQVFPNVTNYVCLFFATLAANPTYRFSKVQDLDQWYADFSAAEGVFDASSLSADPWSFSVGHGAHVSKLLREMPRRLGDIADIFVGLQTSADNVYILNYVRESKTTLTLNSKALGTEWEFEKDLFHPIISGTDVRAYAALPRRQFILFPYRIQGQTAELIPLSELQTLFPRSARYLLENRERLEGREGGKFTGADWHRFGRSQNLGIQGRCKLCVPRLVAPLWATLDNSGFYYLDNVDVGGVTLRLGVTCVDLNLLLALLNSATLRWFFPTVSAPFRGGYFSANKQFLSKLPIPDTSDEQRTSIASLVEYLLWLRRCGVENGVDIIDVPRETLMAGYFEQWVNALVYELFFPESLHAAGLRFFQLAEAANLVPLTQMKPGTELACLRNKFDELYKPDHTLRQSLFALDSIEEVRIIEGKV